MTTILAIGGWDPSAAAGLGRDLATARSLGVHAGGVATAIVSQNTGRVARVDAVPIEVVAAQIDLLLEDLEVSAWKLGLVISPECVESIHRTYLESNRPPLVIDPVIWAGAGRRLVDEATVTAMRDLASEATLLTPNLREARALSGDDAADTSTVAKILAEDLAPARGWCVVTGGDETDGGESEGDEVVDWMSDGDEVLALRRRRVSKAWVRGTGCAFATAATVGLARGVAPPAAVEAAGNFVAEQVAQARELGSGGEVLP